jgi:hypothetical protein
MVDQRNGGEVNPRRIAKFLTALAGAGAQILALGLLDDSAEKWVSVAIGVLTAAAVFLVPNQEVTDGAA